MVLFLSKKRTPPECSLHSGGKDLGFAALEAASC